MDNNIIDKRTKGEWKLNGKDSDKYSTLIECNDTNIALCCYTDDLTSHANAAFIVKACNEYERLIEQNKLLLEALKKAHKLLHTVGSSDWWIKNEKNIANINEAIKKAEQ